MTYAEWEAMVPAKIRRDSVWKVEAYRLGLFLVDLAWHDVTKLARDRRTQGLANQLYRACGSIAANISEGFSRNTGKERARFYEFALGSARESRDWFYQGRHVLGAKVGDHRVDLATQIIKLLLAMIPNQRRSNQSLSKSLSRNHAIT